MTLCSIIILSYNGKELLAEGVPSVIEAVHVAGGDHEIMVVDNGSTDGSAEFVRENFPEVRVLALEKNYRFVGGNNRGIMAAQHDVVVLLNNDMVVDRDFLKPLLEGFTDPSVFAVTSQIYFQDQGKRREETGKTGFFWDKGMIYAYHEEVDQLDLERRYVPTVWAGGGSAAYDRKKFIQLGMFDELYLPCYVDDLDISYAAWKRGWKSLFCAESIVHHKHRATHVKQFTREQLDIIIASHQILFLWKNLTSPAFLFSHFFFLPFHVLKQFKRERRTILLRAVLRALRKAPQAIRSRFVQRPPCVNSDRLILRGSYIHKSVDRSSGPLNILFCCGYIPVTGIHATGNRMFHIARELAKRHHVDILTFIEHQGEEKHVEPLKEFCRSVQCIRRYQSFGEPDYFHITPNIVVKEFCAPEMKQALERALLSGRYDIVQFEYLQMAYLGALLRRFGISRVWVDHEVQHAALWKQFRHESWWKWNKVELYFRWMVMLSFEIWLAKKFDRTIVVTQADQRELLQYTPRLKSAVVPLGVDTSHYVRNSQGSSGNARNVLIFTGYFLHAPNVDAALYFIRSILPLVRKQIPGVEFWIVGSSPPIELTSLSRINGIKVTGWVPDLRPYLDDAAVYVAPIRLGVGIRGKILEALAMEKAVVATPLAARGIPAVDGREIMLGDSAEKFAERVVHLLRNKDVRDEMGRRGREMVCQNFTWEQIACLNEEAIRKAIALEGDV